MVPSPAPVPVSSAKPGVVGIHVEGVAVERGEEDIAATVEDLLGAVAVVKVDVEDRHPLCPVGDEHVGDHGGVVQKAVAAELVRCGVVTGRTAKREGGPAPPDTTRCAACADAIDDSAARHVPPVIAVSEAWQ